MHFKGQSLKGPLNGIVRCVSCDVELHAVGVKKLFKHLAKFAPLLITSRRHGCETKDPKQSLSAFMCTCIRTCYKNAYFYAESQSASRSNCGGGAKPEEIGFRPNASFKARLLPELSSEPPMKSRKRVAIFCARFVIRCSSSSDAFSGRVAEVSWGRPAGCACFDASF